MKISRTDLAERAAEIRPGDIVFVHTGHGHYRTPQSHDRPYMAEDAVKWLIERGIVCLAGVWRELVLAEPRQAPDLR